MNELGPIQFDYKHGKVDWERIAKHFGYKSDRHMFLQLYAQDHEQRNDSKLSSRELAKLLGVDQMTILGKLKGLGIPRASKGGPNFKRTVIDASKFGFDTEKELLEHWRYKEHKSIREMYNDVLVNFGELSWHSFRMKLRKLGIVGKHIYWVDDHISR